MSKTRAIRFNVEEEKMISAFLKANPVFDFSTLTRVAIRQFVENPKIELKKVKQKSTSNVRPAEL